MYCKDCGTLLIENASFCQECGTSLLNSNTQNYTQNTKRAMPLNTFDYCEIKGWLLLVAFTLIVPPIYNAFILLQDLSTITSISPIHQSGILIYDTFALTIGTVFPLIINYFFWSKKKIFIVLYIISLAFYFMLDICYAILCSTISMSPDLFTPVIAKLIIRTIFSGTFLFYIMLSKRVKYTFIY